MVEKSPRSASATSPGALQALTLKLPVTIHKFMDAAELTADDFFKRWKQIGGAPRELPDLRRRWRWKDADRQISEDFIRPSSRASGGAPRGSRPRTRTTSSAFSVVHTAEEAAVWVFDEAGANSRQSGRYRTMALSALSPLFLRALFLPPLVGAGAV